jgi:uncharacterized delta-60 repeat protein
MFYSLSEKCARTLPALFTIIAIAALSSFAQNAKPGPAPEDNSFFGTRYDSAGYANSIRNLRSKPAAGRTALSPAIGEVDTLLNPVMDSVPGLVRATAIQPDGKILVGGYFRTLNGTRYGGLVRLNTDYSVDPTFTATVNGTVMSIAVQADGKIVIGGAFTAVNGVGHNFIARLLSNGAVDTAFNSLGASDVVYDVAVQPDGKIILGGSFFVAGGESRLYAARLNSDGSIDPGFATTFPFPQGPTFLPSIVYSVALQPDGKVILGGLIVKSYLPTQTVSPVLRVNADGSTDNTFDTGTMNSNAYKVAVQPDGKVMAAGFFSNVAGTSRNRIARFNANGSLDTSFDPGTGFDGPVYTFNLRPDGSILAAGVFTKFNGTTRDDVALLNANGSLDTNFVTNVFSIGTVYTALTGVDGRILIGGSIQMPINQRDSLALLIPNGALDQGFTMNSTARGGTRATAVQPDGKMIVGGTFTRVNGTARTSRIVRFNTDGTVDTSFNTTGITVNQLTTLVLQPDGKLLVAGTNIFQNAVGGPNPVPLARLNADGSWDTSFTLGGIPARTGKALAIQPDGKILFSYTIAALGLPFSGGISRLETNGAVDSSFSGGIGLPFESIVVQPDGKIITCAPFGIIYVSTQTGSEAHNSVFRLNADGSHDRSWRVGFVSSENVGFTASYDLKRLPDGKILVGGTLFTDGSNSPAGVARINADGSIDPSFTLNTISSTYEFPRVEDLHVLPNGKIVAGGLFSSIGGISQSNIARLNSNGEFDQSFAANTDGTVFEVAADTTGKVLAGGDFEHVNGVARTGLARLLSEPVVRRTPYDFDGDGKADVSLFRPSEGNWYLLQSTAGFLGFHFGASADKIAPADYDGDGKTDFGVFRPSENTWYIQNSTTGFTAANFGIAEDIPQSGDFDGDGKAEIALWRPSEGNWYTMNLATGETTGFHFGTSGDKPVVGDYDGDGKMDYAVYRPSEGNWYLMKSTEGFTAFHFGVAEDLPVAADYDGDGKTDFGVFRPSEGNWYLMKSTEGFTAFHWGLPTDLPAPADYDGDGKADIAVFRDGQWYLQQSAAGYTVVNFGLAGDKPAPNAFTW